MSVNALKFLAALTLGGVTLLQPALAAPDAGAVSKAVADFERGRQGDADAVDRAAAEFRDLSSGNPANPLLLAYYGSSVTLQAKYAWAPWNKMKYAERGLGTLDKALAMVQPDDDRQIVADMPVGLGTQLLAVSTFLQVPDMFHRFESGKDELRQAMANPAFASAPPRLRAQFLMQAAVVAQKENRREEETARLKQVVDLAPGTPVAQRAAGRLKELSQ